MTAKNLPNSKLENLTFPELLDLLSPMREARKCRLVKRNSGKIAVKELLLAFVSTVIAGEASYLRIAFTLGLGTMEKVSRQAVWKRIGASFVEWIKALCINALCMKMENGLGIHGNSLFIAFPEVYIEDSTCVKLPDSLSDHFPGGFSHKGKCAVARLDALLGLKSWRIFRLNLKAYIKNDQSESRLALWLLKAGDLLIRDLGYYSNESLKAIADRDAFFLSRLKFGTKLYDPVTKAEVIIEKRLKEGRKLDQWLLLGKNQLRVRLVAIPLPPQKAAERRKNAAKDRDRRLNHSPDYMHRLGWTILVTNVQDQTWTSEQVALAYRQRWWIETLFKCWKSHLNLAGQPTRHSPKHPHKAEAALWAIMLIVALVLMPMIKTASNNTNQPETAKQASILKITRLIADHFVHANNDQVRFMVQNINYLCAYDKRKRANALQIQHNIH